MRALIATAILLAWQTVHAADSAAGCYTIDTAPHVEFFPHEAIILFDKAASGQDWYLSDGRQVSAYDAPHMRALKGFWWQEQDKVIVRLSENGKDGFVVRVTRTSHALTGMVTSFGEARMGTQIWGDAGEQPAYITLTPKRCRVQ